MEKYLDKLNGQLQEIEHKIPFLGSIDPAVSKVPVSWHLAHILKVINSITTDLAQSDPSAYNKKFSWKKELVYFTGMIPRGKARAPKIVIPEENISEEDITLQLEKAREGIHSISGMPKNAFFGHPYFGHISRNETPKFLFIHTEHHLKITRDILGEGEKVNLSLRYSRLKAN